MRGFLDQGYRVVKMKIGGADLAEDLRRASRPSSRSSTATGPAWPSTSTARFDLDTALEYGRAIEPYGLFWYEEVGDPLDYRLNAILSEHYRGPIATGENLFSLQDARNLHPLRRHAPGPRLHPGRPGAELRPDRVPAHPGDARASTAGPRVAASRTAGTSSPCTSPPHSSSAATSPTRASSSPPAASPTTPSSRTATSGSPRPPASGSRPRPPSTRCCATCTRERGSQNFRKEPS